MKFRPERSEEEEIGGGGMGLENECQVNVPSMLDEVVHTPVATGGDGVVEGIRIPEGQLQASRAKGKRTGAKAPSHRRRLGSRSTRGTSLRGRPG